MFSVQALYPDIASLNLVLNKPYPILRLDELAADTKPSKNQFIEIMTICAWLNDFLDNLRNLHDFTVFRLTSSPDT